MRCNGDDHVGLAGLLARGSKSLPTSGRASPEPESRSANRFDVLIDAGDNRRHAVLDAGHRIQRPLREYGRQVLDVGAGSDDVRTLEVHLDLDVAFVGDLRLRLDHQADVSILNAVKTIVEPAEPKTSRQAVRNTISDAAVVIIIAIDAVQAIEVKPIAEVLGSESDGHAAPDLGLVLPAVEHMYLGLVQKLRFAPDCSRLICDGGKPISVPIPPRNGWKRLPPIECRLHIVEYAEPDPTEIPSEGDLTVESWTHCR